MSENSTTTTLINLSTEEKTEFTKKQIGSLKYDVVNGIYYDGDVSYIDANSVDISFEESKQEAILVPAAEESAENEEDKKKD